MVVLMAHEVWRDVPGFEGLYIVSSEGNVMSLPRMAGRNGAIRNKSGAVLKQRTTPNGYLKVTLYKDGKPYQISVHRLVMLAFVGDSDLQVNHKDEDKTNNSLTNLEYLTGLENTRYSCCKPVECFNLETGETIKRYDAMCDAEVDGHDGGAISSACLGKHGFTHYHGVGWRYAT